MGGLSGMTSERPKVSVLFPSRSWHFAVLVVILLTGFAVRLYDLTDPPLDYASSRQLRSAIIARGIYYQIAPDVPAWQREVAARQRGSQEMLEPELLENITALTYLVVGGEYLWIARIYSSLFWTLGGLVLYSLLRFLGFGDGAVIGLLYYLFDPFALLAGRTFQPDPLMTAAIICAWLSFLKWGKYHTTPWAWAAGLSAGAAILIKSTAFFFIFFGIAAVLLTGRRFRDLVKDGQVWLIGILAALPALLYHVYGFFISGELRGQLSGRLFNPALWDQTDFYLGWLNTTGKVLGHEIILVLSLLGLALVRNKIARTYLWGTWLGFVVYGFAVSYYVTTHSYYLLPTIPLAAVGLGASGEWLVDRLGKPRLLWLARAGVGAALLLGVATGYYLYGREDFRHEPAYYQKVASFVTPDDSVIALSQDYGFRLAYFGWINVQPWQGFDKLTPEGYDLSSPEGYSKAFTAAMEEFDYFIITRMKDFRQDDLLSEELDNHYTLFKEGGGYRIYDLGERWE